MKYFYVFVYLILLCFISFTSRAEITNVNVTPNVLEVNINTGITSNLNWVVTLSELNANSQVGEFLTANSILALQSVNQTLSVTAPTNMPPQPITVIESLTISAEQAQAWWSAGIRQLRYQRFFEDGTETSQSAFIFVNLVEDNSSTTPPGLDAFRGSANRLEISRIELTFTDETKVQFAQQQSLLRAKLAISYKGIGMLRGFWQIADASTLIGDPIFRNLTLVNQQLSPLQQAEILSPTLPTQNTGRFYVRFCVTKIGQLELNENTNTSCPSEIISTTIGYQIFPAINEVSMIHGIKPDTSKVTIDTVFSWPKVPKTNVYQLQILKRKEHSSVAVNQTPINSELTLVRGMLLPASMNETFLSSFVFSSLNKQVSYYWRISAYDSAGSLLAQSKIKPIQID